MYNHYKQYRCTIIRGKSKNHLDDMLPAYAKIIDELCPCVKEKFDDSFNVSLLQYLPGAIKKTLDNHRTEIAGKLFGMYYYNIEENIVFASDRTKKFLNDNDQPAFFKELCFKMQFPNGMDKPASIIDRVRHEISIRQYPYLLKTLLGAEEKNIILTKTDIGYYVLNALDVLRGKSTPEEVVAQIAVDKESGIERRVHYPDKQSSYSMQHINEQLNYLELANLILVGPYNEIAINKNEIKTINYFTKFWDVVPEFNVYSYNIDDPEDIKCLRNDWDRYYSLLSKKSEVFTTTSDSLGIGGAFKRQKKGKNHKLLGDEGEQYVFELEKERVGLYDKRLLGKVKHVGGLRGLGYDIQSVVAIPGEYAEYVKYIEVKSTKRVTEPDLSSKDSFDTINLTRNEWIAAEQHSTFYSIFRVYFVRDRIIIYIIENFIDKVRSGTVKATPTIYRADFTRAAIDVIIR